MAVTVDLNADMGEGIGNDAALLGIVSSANISCGLHAGSAAIMAQTMRLAAQGSVGIGAHPGYDDRANFGRTRMQLSHSDLADLVAYQVGAAKAVATAQGTRLQHLKLHGALANMASEDVALATTCYRAALDVAPEMTLLVIAATAQEAAARQMGAAWAGEIFADRAYNDDATLVDRSLPGAVLHDADQAAARIVSMLNEGAIIAASGKRIPARIDSICLHGDTPKAVEMAAALRQALIATGIGIARFAGHS